MLRSVKYIEIIKHIVAKINISKINKLDKPTINVTYLTQTKDK